LAEEVELLMDLLLKDLLLAALQEAQEAALLIILLAVQQLLDKDLEVVIVATFNLVEAVEVQERKVLTQQALK
jgi:hypothetical protein|tara:strand:+ start:167 stop:385 length:219 start_codon:yes stop_codon:yes gene_type:complete